METDVAFLAGDFWRAAPWKLEVAQVRGPDPVGALQKVVAGDLRGLGHGDVRKTLLLHPKGQFRALLAVGRWGEEVWLLAPPGCGPRAWDQLQRYLQFSRCLVVPWEGPVTVFVGAGWREGLGLGNGLEAEGEGGPPVFAETLTGLPGGVVLGNLQHEVPVADPEELELARIRVGFPAWGKELTDDVLPQEAGLREPWVSLAKGCYVGQETMARLATYGHVNRLLVRLRGQAVRDLIGRLGPPPWTLEDRDTGNAVGRLTSWAATPDGQLVALGLVHRRAAREGQELATGPLALAVEAVLA